MAKKNSFCTLRTPFEGGAAGWEEYPRPQLKRDSYMTLCGTWELSLDGGEEGPWTIEVPFAPESRLSGVCRNKKRDEKYIYKRSFIFEEGFNRGRLLLHFGAVDRDAIVCLNGKRAGEHKGGYLPFTLDITELSKTGENIISVEVCDDTGTEAAYGKQREKRGGMWYTPISGIWQAVWIESVPEEYIESLRMEPTLDCVRIRTKGGSEKKSLSVTTPDGVISAEYLGDEITLTVPEPRHWTPEDPYLYEFTLQCGDDRIESYFALRTVAVENGYICLNGKPKLFHGLLDQGYYPDGIYLPATPEGYRWDILTMKSMGFNMLRKHIKTEPELFYYYCDKYGMIVFQDMVNSGKYHYFLDTVLPTVGLKKGITHRASAERRKAFEGDCAATVQLLYNHPCVCYYTVFNEGWGQYDADRIYGEMKKLDPSRVWDATSGWFVERESDVKSEHVYFRRLRLKPDPVRPLVLSEFGGYSWKVPGHSYNPLDNYGYKTFNSSEELTAGLSELYVSQVIPAIEESGLCAAVLTQVSDVEDETNGLVTYDRQVIKVDEKVMKNISEKLFEAFERRVKKQ